MLIHRCIRSDELCEYSNDPGGCPDSKTITCQNCGADTEVEDTGAPGGCAHCGSRRVVVQRCEQCPMHELEYVRSHSRAGRLFERVLELEFSCNNFVVPWSDVTAEEAVGLQILKDERDRYQREQQADPNKVSLEEAKMMRLLDRQRRQ